ncbi:hypothetical protein HK405_000885, partial [Cladochytrium tenue]
SLDHVLYVHFVYIYLMDCSLFALLLRTVTQLPQSSAMVSKSLRWTVYYILGVNVVFLLKHLAAPQPPSLVIDFFGQPQMPPRAFLMSMDLVVALLQLSRALVIQSSLACAGTLAGTSRAAISNTNPGANVAGLAAAVRAALPPAAPTATAATPGSAATRRPHPAPAPPTPAPAAWRPPPWTTGSGSGGGAAAASAAAAAFAAASSSWGLAPASGPNVGDSGDVEGVGAADPFQVADVEVRVGLADVFRFAGMRGRRLHRRPPSAGGGLPV